LGFVVLSGIGARLFLRRRSPFALQIRIVLVSSLALVLVGAVCFSLFEWYASLDGLATSSKLVNALFQSITTRTAGFNSVDFTTLTPATVLWMHLWMFVGASPGGTGGGVKTTTMVVLLASVRAVMRGESRVVLGKRLVPPLIVLRSVTIIVIASAAAFVGTLLLLVTEELPFEMLSFEVVSALGTVGLTLGATPLLGPAAKLCLVVIMLLGRIGPLTTAMLLARDRKLPIRYPEAPLMVG